MFLRNVAFSPNYTALQARRPYCLLAIISFQRQFSEFECIHFKVFDEIQCLKIRFIDHLQVVNTHNYNIIANFHTLQIATAQSKSFQSAVSQSVVPW
jgi:hypothetical protein